MAKDIEYMPEQCHGNNACRRCSKTAPMGGGMRVATVHDEKGIKKRYAEVQSIQSEKPKKKILGISAKN